MRHRTVSGGSTPQPSSMTGRAVPCRFKMARLPSGYRSSHRQVGVHMETHQCQPSVRTTMMFGHVRSRPGFTLSPGPAHSTGPDVPPHKTPRQPMLMRFGCAEFDRGRDDDNEDSDHQKELGGGNTEAPHAPVTFWVLGLERLHILDQESKARQRNPSAKPSVPNGHAAIITLRPPCTPSQWPSQASFFPFHWPRLLLAFPNQLCPVTRCPSCLGKETER